MKHFDRNIDHACPLGLEAEVQLRVKVGTEKSHFLKEAF